MLDDLYLGNCEDYLTDIPSSSIDLILTDPPYGTTKNKWDSALDWSFIWQELNRIIRPGAAIVLFAQMPFSAYLVSSNYAGYKHFWKWNKKQSANFAVAKYMPLTVTEDIFVFSSKGEKVTYYPQMTKGKERYRGSKNAKTNGEGFGGIKQVYYKSDEYYPTNLLEFSAVARKQSLHPSQKPVELLEYLLKTYSLEDDRILDFTMGAGSTGVACVNCNRQFVGIEKEEKYFNIAKERIMEALNAR